jgi:Flp pilus assembly pilin Flp
MLFSFFLWESDDAMKKESASGQALVEYGLILVLVALAVVVVVAILGPSVRDVFAAVVNEAGQAGASPPATVVPTTVPTSTPTSPGWTFCADENYYCAFSGTREVRYGANGTYVSLMFTNGTDCSNDVFGDPLFGVYKHCYTR